MLSAPRRLTTIAVTWWIVVGFLFSGPLPAIAAEPSPEETLIVESASRCETRIREHHEQADSARMKANVLLIAGTSLAALGGALAAFLKKEAFRKITGLAGALGAVVSIIPKTLDDPATFRALYVKAERHRDIAVKVHRQLGLVDPSKRVVLTQYVIARLADCESGDPSERPPEPPSGDDSVMLAIAPMDQRPQRTVGSAEAFAREDALIAPRQEDALNALLPLDAWEQIGASENSMPGMEPVEVVDVPHWTRMTRSYIEAIQVKDWSRALMELGQMTEYLAADEAETMENKKQYWAELKGLAKLVPQRDLLPASLRPVEP